MEKRKNQLSQNMQTKSIYYSKKVTFNIQLQYKIKIKRIINRKRGIILNIIHLLK